MAPEISYSCCSCCDHTWGTIHLAPCSDCEWYAEADFWKEFDS